MTPAERHEIARLTAAGAAGYLVKPVTASMLHDAVAEATRGFPAQPPRAASGEPRLAGMRLLVVEDNGFNQQVAQELLEGEGAIVTMAGGGVEGAHLALADEAGFDAILMDLQMPDIDGFEATQRILQRRPDALVIAMTANAMDSDRQACLAAGMRDHVAKPIDLEQLVSCLRRCVGPAVPHATPAPVRAVVPLLEREAALKRLGGRHALYERLALSFAHDAPAEMRALARHLQQPSRADVVRVLHTLRGLAGAVGASALAEQAGQQELALRDGSELGTLDLAVLQALLDDTLAAVHAPADPAAPASSTQPMAASAPAETAAGAEFLEALRRLRVLLVERNMRSVTACEQLGGLPHEGLGPEMAQLAAAVGRLDFARALKACDQLLGRLNPR